MAISQTFTLQRAYGKTAEELATLVEGFAWVLGDYPLAEVKRAFAVWIRDSNQIPTPHDIAKIIEPEAFWEPDWSHFNDLQRRVKEGEYLLSSDRQYLERCRNYSKNG